MLFTPSSSKSEQPISTTTKGESSLSPTFLSSSTPQTPSVTDARGIQTRSLTVSSSSNVTPITNGPQNIRLLSPTESRFSHLPDEDGFYSPSSLSSRLSTHPITPTSTSSKMSVTKSSDSSRRVSCPVSRDAHKKGSRFRFPTTITSSIRDVLMTSSPTANPNTYTNDILHVTKSPMTKCARPSSIFLPVANPVAAAALVEDDELATIEEQPTQSLMPSPSITPNDSGRNPMSSIESSTNIVPSQNYNSKAILNVGGVRHEGIVHNYLLFLFFFINIIIYL